MDRYELKDKYGDEEVLVVYHKSEFINNFKQGFVPLEYRWLNGLCKDSFFLPRYLVEYNPIFRQPIPYILVKYQDKYFVTKRLMNSGEARLVSKISMGVGGHINPVDGSASIDATVVINALHRELFEELLINDYDIETIHLEGLMNDLSDNVSQDHIGIVYILEVNTNDISVRETDKLEGAFMELEEIEKEYDKLESWSKIVFDYLMEQ